MRLGLGVPRVAAVLGALALVFAVLSMHAVDGGAHTPGSAAHAAGAGSPAQGVTLGHLEDVTDDLSKATRAAVTALAPPEMPGESVTAPAVCIAVLLSVVLIARPGVWPTCFRPRLRNSSTRRIAPVRDAFPGRPPDLLTELCVMRT
jgi:hypothetical protein